MMVVRSPDWQTPRPPVTNTCLLRTLIEPWPSSPPYTTCQTTSPRNKKCTRTPQNPSCCVDLGRDSTSVYMALFSWLEWSRLCLDLTNWLEAKKLNRFCDPVY